MKPSERIRAIALAETESTEAGRAMLLASWGHPDINIVTIERYLDEEAERRAKFEADVLERLGKLEALAKPLRYVIAPENMSQAGLAKLIESVKNLGATVLPHGVKVSGPTVEVLEPPFAGWCDRGGVLEKESPAGVYVGDGLPNVRRYEPEANEPE